MANFMRTRARLPAAVGVHPVPLPREIANTDCCRHDARFGRQICDCTHHPRLLAFLFNKLPTRENAHLAQSCVSGCSTLITRWCAHRGIHRRAGLDYTIRPFTPPRLRVRYRTVLARFRLQRFFLRRGCIAYNRMHTV